MPRTLSPEMPIAAIFKAMHPSVHASILHSIKATNATHVALLQAQEIGVGARYQVLCLGPGCTVKSPAELFTDTVIGDLPSQRRVPAGWAPVPADVEKYAEAWNDPRILSEKEKVTQDEPLDTPELRAKANAVAANLRTFGVEIGEVRPVLAFIYGLTYAGAYYKDKDGTEVLYFEEERPKAAARYYYQKPDDTCDWYFSSWREKVGADPVKMPLMFMLRRWSYPDSRPDDGIKAKARHAFKFKLL